MQNIKDKYVICSFGMDKHKLVKVKSETKAKFTFEIDYGNRKIPGLPESNYTQMKNTIVAVASTKEELDSLYKSIADQEAIIDDARKIRFNILRGLKNENQ